MKSGAREPFSITVSTSGPSLDSRPYADAYCYGGHPGPGLIVAFHRPAPLSRPVSSTVAEVRANDFNRSLDDLSLPSAVIVASPLTERVLHASVPAQGQFQHLLAEPREQVTRLPARVAFDEEQRAPFDHERRSSEPADGTAEESFERPSGPTTSGTELQGSREHPDPAGGPIGVGQETTYTMKHLLPVRAPNDEAKEPSHLVVREPSAFACVFAIGADLSLHDIAQAKPTRHGSRRILVFQELDGKIHITQHLEESQGHDGLHSSRSRRHGWSLDRVRQRRSRFGGSSRDNVGPVVLPSNAIRKIQNPTNLPIVPI